MTDEAAYVDRDGRWVQIAAGRGAAAYERDVVTVVVGCCEPLLRAGLVYALSGEPGVRILHGNLDAGSLEEAVIDTQPSVVILGEAIDYALLLRLRVRPTGPAVVVIAQEQTLFWSALEAVGIRCIARSTAVSELVAVVRCAVDFESASQGDKGSQVVSSLRGEVDLLTTRESEVLRYLREDPPLKYAEIAFKMDLAESTVKTYAARLRRKLGVKSKLELSTSRCPGA